MADYKYKEISLHRDLGGLEDLEDWSWLNISLKRLLRKSLAHQ
jgi:hypothetical protein